MPSQFILVDPGDLRLPPSHLGGVDLYKLQLQVAKYGTSIVGMPTPWVHRDKNGLLMLVDGVTRATRVAKYLPGQLITVEITKDRPKADFGKLPTVRDKLP